MQKIYRFKLSLRFNISSEIPNIEFYQNDTKACIIEVHLYNDTTRIPIDLSNCVGRYVAVKHGRCIYELKENDLEYKDNVLRITLPSYCIEHPGEHLMQIILQSEGSTISFPIFNYFVLQTLDGYSTSKTDKLNYMNAILNKQNEFEKDLESNYYTSKEVDEKINSIEGIDGSKYALKDHTHNYMQFHPTPVDMNTVKVGDVFELKTKKVEVE